MASSSVVAPPALGIGGTPLLELKRLSSALGPRVRLFIKAEWLNPGGSVKDRAGWGIVRAALDSGALRPGGTLLDATSGNTGISYAWLGARLGFKVRLCVASSINPDRRRILEAYGAELVLTDPLQSSDGAILEARAIAARDAGAFYADQYGNPANWRAHFETTGPEVWEQTDGRVTHFVAGLGTSGTFVGTGRRLKGYNPDVRLVSVQPDSPFHGLEGLKHMGTAIVPPIYDPSLADETAAVSTEEGQRMSERLAKEEGLLAGPSGGANVAAALRLAERLAAAGTEARIVTVAPDGGERYLGDDYWRRA